jgi:hypothetical protein
MSEKGRLRRALSSLRSWLRRRLEALVGWVSSGTLTPAGPASKGLKGEDLQELAFFLEGRIRDAELRLDALQGTTGRTSLTPNTHERVEALVTTVAVLTKSVVQLSLQVQHLYDELGMDPNDPLEDIFFSSFSGDEGDDDTDEGPDEGGFGGGLGGMIN